MGYLPASFNDKYQHLKAVLCFLVRSFAIVFLNNKNLTSVLFFFRLQILFLKAIHRAIGVQESLVFQMLSGLLAK
jgi:hypothetical protein